MLRLIRWLSRCPLRLLHVLGAPLGWGSYLVSPSYRRRFTANAAQAGVPAARWRPAIAEAGRLLLELPLLWMRPPDASLAHLVRFEGQALLEAAHAAGRGIVFLTPHMGSFEVTAQAYAECFGHVQPITVLYRPARKRWLRGLVRTARARPNLQAVPANLAGVRQMLRALRRGQAVGLLPDQVPPHGLGVWAPFFGRDAYTMTLAARLIRQTGARALLAWGERLPRGAGFVVHLAPFDEPLGDDAAECAAAINRAMERLILQRPEQYLWGYDRYKAPRQAAPADAAE